MAARSQRRTAGRALAAEAVDRPVYFPEATPPLPACPTCADARVRRAASCTRRRLERDLRDRQHVRLLNDRRSVGLVSTVTDEVQPGKVLVPGQRTTARCSPGRSTCCAPGATPISARVLPTRAASSKLPLGRTARDGRAIGLICVRDSRDRRVFRRGRPGGSAREFRPPAALSCGYWRRRYWR